MKFLKIFEDRYVLFIIATIWIVLFYKGHKIIPGAKWLSEVIPEWLVNLNLVFLCIFSALVGFGFTLLVKIPLPRIVVLLGTIVTVMGFLFSSILANIGYNRFPSRTLIVNFIAIVLLVSGLQQMSSMIDKKKTHIRKE